MIHTYKIHGMSCGSCVGKVEKALSELGGITSAKVSLDPPQALLEMGRHISLEELQAAVLTAGEYTIESEHKPSGKSMEPSGDVITKIAAYKPLILILLYIFGVSLMVSTVNGGFESHLFFRTFMAGFFLTFSFFKFLDLNGFATSYATYDLLAAIWRPYGHIYAFLELGLGIAYLTAFSPVLTYAATIVVMGFSAIGVVKSVLDKRKIKCACLGTVFNLPMSTVTIVEDVSMVAMAAIMLLYSLA